MSATAGPLALRPLGPGFFRGSTIAVAQRLLGTLLVHDTAEGRTVGRIVETEAYLSADDGASHSARGRTERCASMFLAPGHAYVYLIYGMHLCFNVVTARTGVGEAVLVRAIEPLEGVELMASRRKRAGRAASVARRELANGPGKCAQAMGIERAHDGCALSDGPLRLAARPRGWRSPGFRTTPRIGITKSADLPLRFLLAEPRRATQ